MFGERHDLHHEFPQHAELIHELLGSNREFASLYKQYDDLDAEILDLERAVSVGDHIGHQLSVGVVLAVEDRHRLAYTRVAQQDLLDLDSGLPGRCQDALQITARIDHRRLAAGFAAKQRAVLLQGGHGNNAYVHKVAGYIGR